MNPDLSLRQALQEWFAIKAREGAGDLPAAHDIKPGLHAVRTAWAALPPGPAERIYREEAGAFYRATGICPGCGLEGPTHLAGSSSAVPNPADPQRTLALKRDD